MYGIKTRLVSSRITLIMLYCISRGKVGPHFTLPNKQMEEEDFPPTYLPLSLPHRVPPSLLGLIREPYILLPFVLSLCVSDFANF